MCVPSARVTGGKGKSVDYGASAWKRVFCRHLCGTGQPFALGVASFCGFIAAFTPLFAPWNTCVFMLQIIILHAPPKQRLLTLYTFFLSV